jgi:hypothetical protein
MAFRSRGLLALSLGHIFIEILRGDPSSFRDTEELGIELLRLDDMISPTPTLPSNGILLLELCS